MQIKLTLEVGVSGSERRPTYEEIQALLRLSQRSIVEKYASRIAFIGSYSPSGAVSSSCGSATITIDVSPPFKDEEILEPVKS